MAVSTDTTNAIYYNTDKDAKLEDLSHNNTSFDETILVLNSGKLKFANPNINTDSEISDSVINNKTLLKTYEDAVKINSSLTLNKYNHLIEHIKQIYNESGVWDIYLVGSNLKITMISDMKQRSAEMTEWRSDSIIDMKQKGTYHGDIIGLRDRDFNYIEFEMDENVR